METDWEIPPTFWDLLSAEEFSVLCHTSTLNAEQCRKLWRHLGKFSEPPRELTVTCHRDDVLREFPLPKVQ